MDYEMIMKEAAFKIRKYRELQNMTREEFCEALHYDINHWGTIERGSRFLTMQKLLEICDYFHVNITEFIQLPCESYDTSQQIATINQSLKDCNITQLAILQKFIKEILPHIT